MLPSEDTSQLQKQTQVQRGKGGGMIFQANSSQRKAGEVILISAK